MYIGGIDELDVDGINTPTETRESVRRFSKGSSPRLSWPAGCVFPVNVSGRLFTGRGCRV